MKRRRFVQSATLTSITTLLGSDIVFAASLPENYIPLGLQDPNPFKLFKKNMEMVVLNDKPWNIEAQAHLLDDKITPNSAMFIRNNGLIPKKCRCYDMDT